MGVMPIQGLLINGQGLLGSSRLVFLLQVSQNIPLFSRMGLITSQITFATHRLPVLLCVTAPSLRPLAAFSGAIYYSLL